VIIVAVIALIGLSFVHNAESAEPIPKPVSDWQIQITEMAGIVISHKSVPVLSSAYVFWGSNWRWASPRLRIEGLESLGLRAIKGSIPGLKTEISGSVARLESNKIKFTWNLTAREHLNHIIGGGISFHLKAQSASFRGQAKKPKVKVVGMISQSDFQLLPFLPSLLQPWII